MSLHPRVAIVTGGGRGIGRTMALALAQAGARVIVSAAREKAEIEAVADEAERRLGERRIVPLVADVTREDDCARLVGAATDRFGRLDVLVNNAGRGMKYVSETFITGPTRFWEVAPATWRMVIDANVVGPFLMARGAYDDRGRLGADRQHLDEPRDDAAARLLALWAVESGARIRDDHLGAGFFRHGGDGQRAPAGRRDADGLIPDGVAPKLKAQFLDPAIVGPPIVWLAFERSDGVTGRRFVAARWRTDLPEAEAAEAAADMAGWTVG